MANASQVMQLEEILKKELHTAECKALGYASGGCINEGQSYKTDHGKVFVKINEKSEARKMFGGEFDSLQAILRTNTVRVPKPIKVLEHPSGSGAVFILEHLEMKNLQKYQSQLGTDLGRLHLDNINKLKKAASESNKIGRSQDTFVIEQFGFSNTTCCGYIAQNNEWHNDWVYGDSEARSLWSRLKLQIPELFKGVDIKPSLLHGDLWGGNVGEIEVGPVAFDPASYYGHHEFDLAIAGMFGGFSKEFYDSYHQLIPKEKGFDKRHQLYLLFHHLNHWNHFGTSYRSSSLAIMRKLLEK